MMMRRRTAQKVLDKDSDSAVEDDDDDYGDDEGNERERPDSTAFGRAFRKIMKKKVPETSFTEAMVSFPHTNKEKQRTLRFFF